MQIEEPARQSAALLRAGHRDREDLRLTGGDARDDETDRPPAERCPMREHAAVEKQPLEFVFAPAATKRSTVQRRKRRCVARTRFTQHRLRPGEEAGEWPSH